MPGRNSKGFSPFVINHSWMNLIIRLAVILIILLGSGIGLTCRAQVAPSEVSSRLLQQSVEDVLNYSGDIDWKSYPLSEEVKTRLTPELKQKKELPDTLVIGWITDEGKSRWIIPDIAPSKSETFSFVLYLDHRKSIIDVDILKYRESYGYEIDYPFFRKQYRGKSKPGEIQFGRTIQNISGATISVRSLTHAVHDLISIVNQLELE